MDSDAYDYLIVHNIIVIINGNTATFLGEDDCKTNRLIEDTDGDGLLDGEEADPESATDPLDFDTDNDGLLDGHDIESPSEPWFTKFLTANIVYFDETFRGELDTLGGASDPTDTDTDDDGLPDGFETRYGLKPTDNGTADALRGPQGDRHRPRQRRPDVHMGLGGRKDVHRHRVQQRSRPRPVPEPRREPDHRHVDCDPRVLCGGSLHDHLDGDGRRRRLCDVLVQHLDLIAIPKKVVEPIYFYDLVFVPFYVHPHVSPAL